MAKSKKKETDSTPSVDEAVQVVSPKQTILQDVTPTLGPRDPTHVMDAKTKSGHVVRLTLERVKVLPYTAEEHQALLREPAASQVTVNDQRPRALAEAILKRLQDRRAELGLYVDIDDERHPLRQLDPAAGRFRAVTAPILRKIVEDDLGINFVSWRNRIEVYEGSNGRVYPFRGDRVVMDECPDRALERILKSRVTDLLRVFQPIEAAPGMEDFLPFPNALVGLTREHGQWQAIPDEILKLIQPYKPDEPPRSWPANNVWVGIRLREPRTERYLRANGVDARETPEKDPTKKDRAWTFTLNRPGVPADPFGPNAAPPTPPSPGPQDEPSGSPPPPAAPVQDSKDSKDDISAPAIIVLGDDEWDYSLLSGSNSKQCKGGPLVEKFRLVCLFLPPANLAPGRNLCRRATEGCKLESCFPNFGRLAHPQSREAMFRRKRLLEADPKRFVAKLRGEIEHKQAVCSEGGLNLAVRLNDTSDLEWEWHHPELFDGIESTLFYDYTKIFERLDDRRLGQLPYFLTLSRSEANGRHCLQALAAGHNVAVVFREAGRIPAEWEGYPVLRGDLDDLRFLDPPGHVVGLYAKGLARHDTRGFVVDVPPGTLLLLPSTHRAMAEGFAWGVPEK